MSNTALNPEEAIPVSQLVEWLDAPIFAKELKTFFSHRLGMEGTGDWLLNSNEFRVFVEGKAATLWATGELGSGKSVLCATAINHLRSRFEGRDDVAIAFVMLREPLTTRTIVASLLRQLLEANQGVPIVRAAYVRTKWLESEFLEEEATAVLKDIVGSLYRVYIFIDGLEEMPDDVIAGVLRAIGLVGGNVLITSEVLEQHTYLAPDALYVPIRPGIEKDIDIFVVARIKRSRRLMQILKNGELTLVNRLKDLIREASGGRFLHARLIMDALKPCSSINSIFKPFHEIPRDLPGLYDRTILRINRQSKEDAEAAHRALAWVGQLLRPVISQELQYGLAVSYEDEVWDDGELIPDTLLYGMLGGIAYMEDYEDDYAKQEVKILHPTAPEFYRTYTFSKLVAPSASIFVALSVTVYLSENIGELQKLETKEAFDKYVDSDKRPLLRYAVDYWAEHARISQQDGPLHPFILSFLNNREKGYPRSYHFDSRLTGLHLAARYGLIDVITSKVLPIESIPGDEQTDGFTPFHHAAATDQATAMEALLANYSGVSIPAANGDTPLHTAVRAGAAATVRRLLSFARLPKSDLDSRKAQGLDGSIQVNARNKEGLTPLDIACQLQSNEVLALLLSHPDVGVDLRDSEGRSPFWHACTNRLYDGAAKTLLSSYPGLDLDVSDATGNTAFMEACLAGLETVVESLLKTNPGFASQENQAGLTPFLRLCHYHNPTGVVNAKSRALEKAHLRLMDTLLRANPAVDINYRDEKGQTPLIHAAREGSVAKVLFLLARNGIEVNVQDKEGMSALMHACSGRSAVRRPVVEAILDGASVDVDLRDLQGRSAPDIVRELKPSPELGFVPKLEIEATSAIIAELAKRSEGMQI